jgi:predicted acylesterase/phospholipase RssA
MAYRPRTRDQHFEDAGPKRILALDGGGLRGILTLGILQKVEDELRQRHGSDNTFRLSHYFDLIAGTSTGAIIAATLALGWTVEQITQKYFELGRSVFQKSRLRDGFVRAKYDEQRLSAELQRVYGADTTLGGNALQTGLLVVIKRLDSGSPWPISNNPHGQFYGAHGNVIGNADYTLWQAVRASTAAPDYFDPERITIAQQEGYPSIVGDFVDGGVSPYNNPALQAFMYATIDGYRLRWPTGPDNILLVSVGTGAADPAVRHSALAGVHALRSLLSLMEDCGTLQELMLQWMSNSPTARPLDSEVGDLRNDLVAARPLLTYLRYNVELRRDALQTIVPDKVATLPVETLSDMDAPENMPTLHDIGVAAGNQFVERDHFPHAFDLS